MRRDFGEWKAEDKSAAARVYRAEPVNVRQELPIGLGIMAVDECVSPIESSAISSESRLRRARRQLLQPLERRLQHLAQVLGVATQSCLLVGIGGLLVRLKDHEGGIWPLRLELDPHDGFTREPRGGLSAQPFCLVPPLETTLRFEGGDHLVDLGVLTSPLAAEPLSPAEAGAFQNLDAGRSRVPLR
jgi:hypothetical protein